MVRTGFESSPEIGGRDPDRKRAMPESDNRRPRTDLAPNRDDEREPTVNRGLLNSIENELRAADKAIQRALAPGEPLDFADLSRRPERRPPNDELNTGVFRPAKPPEEEEPRILPGDPDDLGERGRRRRTRDDVNSSPVLRRGLLGV